MSDLCERLQDMGEAGVYRLTCPVEVLHGNIALAELCCFEADVAQVQGKGALLTALAAAIQAPDWFGHNFDALADALGDLSWLADEAPGYVLLLTHAGDTLGLLEADYAAVMDIFAETVAWWRSQGKPFWVFLA
ncbi:MAG: barstar family protein [Pseudomonadota bacterium]